MLADRLKINYAKINAKIFQFIHFLTIQEDHL